MTNPANIQPQPVDFTASTERELLAMILIELRALRCEVREVAAPSELIARLLVDLNKQCERLA